tara:strand:+ start:7374 stop:8498 length:1125 start_codon:yes stop_codon:yes gene_type:complete
VIVTSFPFPEGKATSNRVMAIANGCLKKFKQSTVTIICSSNKPNKSIILRDNLRVTNIQNNDFNRKNYFIRIYRELMIAVKLFQSSGKINPDITFVTIPSPFLLIPLIFYSKKREIILDIRDAVWTYFSNPYFKWVLKKTFSLIFSLIEENLRAISVTNLHEAKSLSNLTEKSSFVVPNGISIRRYSELSKIKHKAISSNIKVVYTGNVGIAQELSVLIYLARYFKDKIIIEIIGDGAELEDIKKQCHIMEIHNINFHGFLCKNEIYKFLESADILFAQIGSKFSSAIPSKVFEYIASGRRVLLGLPDGPAKNIFRKFKGTEIYDVNHKNEIINSLQILLNDAFDDDDRKHNLKILKANFIREEITENFLNEIF